MAAVAALAWLTRRSGRAGAGRLAAGFALALVPILAAPVAAQLLWLAITMIRPGYAELLDPYRPIWYRLAVLALAAAIVVTWYALLRRRIGPAALAVGGLAWLALLGVLLAVAVPGGAYLTTLPALAGAFGGLVALRTRQTGPWPVVAVTAAAAVGVVILLPTVVLLFPALGMAMGGVAALVAVLLGLTALPVVDLLHPQAGGQRGLLTLRARRLAVVPAGAAAAAVVLAGVGLAVDRFDAAHPAPTHLMYALDTDTGEAQWVSHEEELQPWTAEHVSPVERASLRWWFPALGDKSLRVGTAQNANLPAPAVQLVSDSTVGGERTLRVRVVPQRTVRLVSLHVDAETAEVKRAEVAGRAVPVQRQPTIEEASLDRWGFGLVFHAPPPEEADAVTPVRLGQAHPRGMARPGCVSRAYLTVPLRPARQMFSVHPAGQR
ncbi:hypothetical protein [Micromonospora sp. NPDC050695]|uniref:hypothetical protein n=1 Tax=unclassified Micromonospora TaxID=2617518 RepID=UPI003406CB72